MATDERSQLVAAILHSLKQKRVRADAISKIHEAIGSASVRPLRVLYECCVNGSISTEDLKTRYGYIQPPRAARDVRELGFNLLMKNSKTSDNRRMAVYYIDDFNSFEHKEGRRVFTKAEKNELVRRDGGKCFYCTGVFLPNELQIDHRVPFEIAGNSLHEQDGLSALILVCSSCNRSKSWSCESCENFSKKDVSFCGDCYWFNPDGYHHIRGRKAILVNIVINSNEPGYDVLKGMSRPEIKEILGKIK